MTSLQKTVLWALALALLFAAPPALSAWAAEPGNAAALKEVKTGKVVFDVNLHSINSLPGYLMAIKKTFTDLKAAGVEPKIVIAFRGQSVAYVLKSAKEKHPQTAEKVAAQLKELKEMGVVLEVCNLAMSLLKLDTAQVPDEMDLVGNTFVSLTGYQAQGYGLIPIM